MQLLEQEEIIRIDTLLEHTRLEIVRSYLVNKFKGWEALHGYNIGHRYTGAISTEYIPHPSVKKCVLIHSNYVGKYVLSVVTVH